jgi:hypothetical protein
MTKVFSGGGRELYSAATNLPSAVPDTYEPMHTAETGNGLGHGDSSVSQNSIGCHDKEIASSCLNVCLEKNLGRTSNCYTSIQSEGPPSLVYHVLELKPARPQERILGILTQNEVRVMG